MQQQGAYRKKKEWDEFFLGHVDIWSSKNMFPLPLQLITRASSTWLCVSSNESVSQETSFCCCWNAWNLDWRGQATLPDKLLGLSLNCVTILLLNWSYPWLYLWLFSWLHSCCDQHFWCIVIVSWLHILWSSYYPVVSLRLLVLVSHCYMHSFLFKTMSLIVSVTVCVTGWCSTFWSLNGVMSLGLLDFSSLTYVQSNKSKKSSNE